MKKEIPSRIVRFEKSGCFPSTEIWKQMEILLERSQESDFGFTLGKENDRNILTANDSQWEDRYRGHVVTSIKSGGAAQREGTLQVGDRVLEINGVSVESMTYKMILQLLQQSGNFVVLLIQYRINKLDPNGARHLPVRIHLSKVAGKSLDVTLACAEKNGKEVIVVDTIYEAGMTERMGLLNVGDQVLEINGKRLISLQAANEILDSTFQDFWVEMVMIPKHRETRFPARMGFDTSNEIKYSLSADNYPDVARTNTNKHNWTNQTTSCYPNFPATKFKLKSIKNVFNSCDPLKHSFCSASQGNLASKKNGDFRNTCHDLSCFQSSQRDSHFKYERSQPTKDNFLQNNCIQNGPNIADSPNVGGFATNKPSTRVPDLMYSVLLTKPRESIDLGIFISEGNEQRNVVQAVQEFSLADQTKAIHVGDEILRVNGLNLCGLPSEKAQMMILREFSTSDELCLVIRKTFHQTNVKKRCEMLAQERFDSTVVPQRNQPIEEILSNHCFIPRQNFHIGNPHFDVRAVVHHSLDDLGKHQNLKMSSISDPAPFFSPQSQGRIKLTIKPLPDAIHKRPDETSLISKTCSDINDTTLSLKSQAEEIVETEQLNTTFQNLSSDSNSEKNVKNALQDNKLEVLLSTLHHIDSDPPSPVARLSSLFDFLDSEDDLDRPFSDKSQDVNKENSVINSAPESVKPQAGSQNSIKSLSVKRKAECSKTANRCICSLTYLTCSTSATTTTKHTTGSPRGNSSTQNCSYRTGDIASSIKKDIRVSATCPSKFKKYGSVTQAEMCYDQWSKLFESIQFPSVESFSDNMECDQNTASCTDATVNFLSDRMQPRPRPISVESTADYQVSSQEKQTIEGSTPTDPELHAVPKLLDDLPTILPALDVIAITLTRELPTDSFGFGLSDGIQESGIFVSGIMPGGPAENALQLYDKVIQANGADTSTMTTSSIISTIKEAGRTLELVVCRQERNRNPND